MNVFPGKDGDPAGLETLESFAHADSFNQWLFDSVAPYCSGKILEIGCGIGNISKLLLDQNEFVVLSDFRQEYCDIVKQRFRNQDRLKGVFRIDLLSKDPFENNPTMPGPFDSVIALNVIEHIGDDSAAIRTCRKLLRADGHLVVLVPAFSGLYNPMDKELGHFRRYTKKTIKALLESAGMKVTNLKYFNSIGIAGWWLSGSLFRRKRISRVQLKIYNTLVPLFRLIGKILSPFAGLSVIAVATGTPTNE
jgi:SAM-dependent methyltransferase